MPGGAVASPAPAAASPAGPGPARRPLPGVRSAAGSGLAAPAWAVPPGPAWSPARRCPLPQHRVTVVILAVFSLGHHQRLPRRGRIPPRRAPGGTRCPDTSLPQAPRPCPPPHTPPGQFAQSYSGGTGGAAHLLRHRGSPSAAPSRLRARFASRPPARPGRETRPASPDGAGAGRTGRTRKSRDRAARPVSSPPAPQRRGEAGWAALSPRCFQGAASPLRAGAGVRASGQGGKGGRKDGRGRGRGGEGRDGKGSP